MHITMTHVVLRRFGTVGWATEKAYKETYCYYPTGFFIGRPGLHWKHRRRKRRPECM